MGLRVHKKYKSKINIYGSKIFLHVNIRSKIYKNVFKIYDYGSKTPCKYAFKNLEKNI